MNSKNKGGRPKEDLSSLPKDWYKDVLDLYKEGASDSEIKAMIITWRGSFSNDLWDRWLLEEVAFSETIRMGRLLSEAWWNRNGRENLWTREFNYQGWYMQMKNRFGWSDRVENKTDMNVTAKDVKIKDLLDFE